MQGEVSVLSCKTAPYSAARFVFGSKAHAQDAQRPIRRQLIFILLTSNNGFLSPKKIKSGFSDEIGNKSITLARVCREKQKTFCFSAERCTLARNMHKRGWFGQEK